MKITMEFVKKPSGDKYWEGKIEYSGGWAFAQSDTSQKLLDLLINIYLTKKVI